MASFERTFQTGWAQMDSNGHLRNTAFMDLAVDVRLQYLASAGFGVAELTRHAIGPVIRHEEIDYLREFRLLDRVRISLQMAGLSEDGSRFTMRNEFYRDDGVLAARASATGGWLDLKARSLAAPPTELLAALQALERTTDFVVLDSSVRRR